MRFDASDECRAIRDSIRCLAKTDDVCGEGVVWHPKHNAVYWTDINRGLLHRLALSSKEVETWAFDQPVTALGLTTDPERLLVVLGGRVLVWSPRNDRRDNVLFTLPQWPVSRCNDARVDPGGILWLGTMQNNIGGDGSTRQITDHIGELLSLNATGVTHTWQNGVGIGNTIAWSPAEDLMYFADTLRNEIYIYEYDKSAQRVSNQRIFTKGFERGLPDGSAIDVEGFLWNCRYGGGCIARFAPDGSVDLVIDVPVPNPTTCAFGGPDLRTLYFTSAGEGTQRGGPEDGGLFSMRVPVRGLETTPFRLTA